MSAFWMFLGCAALDDLKEDVEGVTNPIVIQALLLGVEAPTDERVDLTGTAFADGTAATVMLADAAEVDQLEDAPVTGASVGVLLSGTGRVDLNDDGGGTYSASGAEGLGYPEGEDATVSATFGGEESQVTLRLPRAPSVTVPENIQPGRDVPVDLSGQGFDNVLVAVFDLQSGEMTYNNAPTGIEDLYDLTHGDGAEAVTIPGAAVEQDSVFVLAVAGLKNADAEDISNANTALSAFIAGKTTFVVTSTVAP